MVPEVSRKRPGPDATKAALSLLEKLSCPWREARTMVRGPSSIARSAEPAPHHVGGHADGAAALGVEGRELEPGAGVEPATY
jgi:hypothetical protein